MRKLLCWLGLHSWEKYDYELIRNKEGAAFFWYYDCKHCEKIKTRSVLLSVGPNELTPTDQE